jgi:ubiquinone/menaquinone biosynthesis C-methylase UbiE
MVVLERSLTTHSPSNSSFVMLDPAVEVLEVEVSEYRLLCHGHFEVGMAVPPGDGLLEFVTTLKGKPVRVGELREEFDDQEIIDKMLASLIQYGFIYETSQACPSTEELARLRTIAEQTRQRTTRRLVVIDLDVPTSIEDLSARLNAEENPAEVQLRCARLADHKLTLAALAQLRQVGTVRMYRTTLQTADLSCDKEICQSLIRLGAAVVLEGVRWPAPDHPIPGLTELTRHCVAVHALMTPDLSILDKVVRDRVATWAGSVFISGLYVQLEADALWPAGDVTNDAFISVFDAVAELEDELGDVQIVNLPSDEVLLGNTLCRSWPTQLSELANRFRMAYLRWRIPALKSSELDNTFSQIPEVEEKLVPAQEDLLPNNPELLLLRPGRVVLDVCGGMGRVARRLAPLVGKEGLVISIEMLRCVSDRARHFVCERNITNVDFRPGLAQRIPLPDSTIDAAVNEWTAGIWELGLGKAMVNEMTRVVRPGGRLAVTHRLVRLPLTRLGEYWAQYEDIYEWMCDAFEHPQLTIVTKRVWGQVVPTLVGENATFWRKQYLPRLIDPFDMIYDYEEHPGAHADVYLTIIAQRQ